jgi:hypothetical protein
MKKRWWECTTYLFIPITFDSEVGEYERLNGGPSNHAGPDSLKISCQDQPKLQKSWCTKLIGATDLRMLFIASLPLLQTAAANRVGYPRELRWGSSCRCSRRRPMLAILNQWPPLQKQQSPAGRVSISHVSLTMRITRKQAGDPQVRYSGSAACLRERAARCW